MRHFDWIFPLRAVTGVASTALLVSGCSGDGGGSDSSSDTGTGGYFGVGGSSAVGGMIFECGCRRRAGNGRRDRGRRHRRRRRDHSELVLVSRRSLK